MIKGYYQYLHMKACENLDLGKFLDTCNLPHLNHGNIAAL